LVITLYLFKMYIQNSLWPGHLSCSCHCLHKFILRYARIHCTATKLTNLQTDQWLGRYPVTYWWMVIYGAAT